MPRNIVVHFSGGTEDDVRLSYAAQVARLFTAHLTGIHVRLLPEPIAYIEPTITAVHKELVKESRRQADVVSQKIAARLDDLEIAHELRPVDVLAGQAGAMLAAEVRSADLYVGTMPYGLPADEARVEEEVLLGSGRGCFFVPPGGTPRTSFGTCLVAWNDSRESARAVAEALPFLRQADKVVVAIVETEGASEQYRIEAGADIGRYLSRHDVAAEVRTIGGWADAGEALVNEAKMIDSDLIVMGGYGHSRLREWIVGGVTRHVLRAADVPVLTAH